MTHGVDILTATLGLGILLGGLAWAGYATREYVRDRRAADTWEPADGGRGGAR